MNLNPLVSVVIPTYNRANLLPKAIESVFQQTYKNIEIIVVNDGSTDSTLDVLKRYAGNIRIIQANHSGTSNARNLGMKASRGNYICFLDSDDSYYPHKIEIQVEVIEANPEIAMISTEVSGVFPDGKIDQYHLRNYHPTYGIHNLAFDTIYLEKKNINIRCVQKEIPFYYGRIFKYVLMGTLVMSNTVMFKRQILDVVGYQDERFKYGQDYNFVVRICKEFNVGFVEIPTYKLHYHDGQATRFITKKLGAHKERKLRHIEGLKTLLTTVKECAFDDKEYYAKHSEEVLSRIAELEKEIGYLYCECADYKQASQYLKSAYEFEKKKFPLIKSCAVFSLVCLKTILRRHQFIDIMFFRASS